MSFALADEAKPEWLGCLFGHSRVYVCVVDAVFNNFPNILPPIQSWNNPLFKYNRKIRSDCSIMESGTTPFQYSSCVRNDQCIYDTSEGRKKALFFVCLFDNQLFVCDMITVLYLSFKSLCCLSSIISKLSTHTATLPPTPIDTDCL